MAGIVQAVLTDHEIELIQKWAELAGVEYNGTAKERSLLSKIESYGSAVACRITKDGPVCKVPQTRAVTPGDVRAS